MAKLEMNLSRPLPASVVRISVGKTLLKTCIRGTVMVYAAKTISDDPWVRTHMPELKILALPRGVIRGEPSERLSAPTILKTALVCAQLFVLIRIPLTP